MVAPFRVSYCGGSDPCCSKAIRVSAPPAECGLMWRDLYFELGNVKLKWYNSIQ